MAPRQTRDRTIYAEKHAAERIAAKRKEHGYTVRKLSELMSVEGCPIRPSAISEIASGVRGIDIDELVAFARVFRLRLDELVDPASFAADEIARLQLEGNLATAALEFADEFRAKALRDYENAATKLNQYWIQHPEGRDPLDPAEAKRRQSYAIDQVKKVLASEVGGAEARTRARVLGGGEAE